MHASEAVARIQQLSPNTVLNGRCPWKGDTRVSRLWCPCHAGRWVRLLVSSDKSNDVVLNCEAGCTQEDVEMFIFGAGTRRHSWRQHTEDPIEYSM